MLTWINSVSDLGGGLLFNHKVTGIEGDRVLWEESVMNAADLQQYLNTILAALRYYQEHYQGDPYRRTDAIHDIATNGGEDISLDDEGIDTLCLALNMGELELVESR